MRNLNLLFTVLVLLTLGTFNTQAQTSKKNLFKVNILSPLVRTASVFYEREIGENTSAQIGFAYTGASIGDTKLRGYGITPEFRFYLSDKGTPEGFFIAPFTRYRSFDLINDATEIGGVESKANWTSIGGGLLVGGQWIFKDIISLDIWGGPSYGTNNINVESGAEDDFDVARISGFGFRSGVTLGIAF